MMFRRHIFLPAANLFGYKSYSEHHHFSFHMIEYAAATAVFKMLDDRCHMYAAELSTNDASAGYQFAAAR